MDNQIKALAQEIISLHNLSYNSISEAKKELKLGEIDYCFDALSLYSYSSSLNTHEECELSHYLRDYFDKETSNDHRKCMKEYGVLFKFNQVNSYLYDDFTVYKEIQPDFILCGDIRIGIEVVELITPQDGVMRKIANKNFGKGKTKAKIYEAAKEKHGTKADQFKYLNLGGTNAIAPKRLTDVNQMLLEFSSKIFNKWKKYRGMINDFDKFIVLCDARLTVISRKDDCDRIMRNLELLDANISGITVCFLYLTNIGSATTTNYSL